MPFGLSSAPRTFTKVLAVLAASLREVPVRLVCYLDNILIFSSLASQADWERCLVFNILQSHSFTLNLDKIHLSPTTRILHLGALIDSIQGRVYLSPDRQSGIRSLVTQVLSQKKVPLFLLSQLLGKLISSIAIVPWVRLHLRLLQWFLLPF